MEALFNFQPAKSGQLRGLITHLKAQVTALQVIFNENSNTDALSQYASHVFLMKGDKGTRPDQELKLQKCQEFTSLDIFIKFMKGGCNAQKQAVALDDKKENKGNAFLVKSSDRKTKG